MEKSGAVAQLAERNVRNVEAGSSTLLRSIFGLEAGVGIILPAAAFLS